MDGLVDGYFLVHCDGRWLNVFCISSQRVLCKNPALEPMPEASPVGQDQGEMLAVRAQGGVGAVQENKSSEVIWVTGSSQ